MGPDDVRRQTGVGSADGDQTAATAELVGDLAHAAHLGQVAGHADQVPVAVEGDRLDGFVDDGDLHVGRRQARPGWAGRYS